MKILYITFIDFGDFSSGSSVRPQKIYNAFIEQGHEVKLLEGLNNKLKLRRKNVKEILKWLKTNRPDICYVEPPSGPFFNLIDHYLLYRLRLKKIPIGLFYRDAYWKFANWWNKTGIERLILTAMHIFDSITFTFCCKIIYFPSMSMAKLFNFKNQKILPPAGENKILDTLPPEPLTAIYVGGVSERYGTPILLKAFEILNETKNFNIKLKMICRVSENDLFIAPYLNAAWLETIKASGSELNDIYKTAHIGIIPFKRDIYVDFAVPVKLMEYLSYTLPIVTTNCIETASFVKENELGAVCEDNAEALADAIYSLCSHIDTLNKYKENSKKSLLQSNLWTHRASKIVEDLGDQNNFKGL